METKKREIAQEHIKNIQSKNFVCAKSKVQNKADMGQEEAVRSPEEFRT